MNISGENFTMRLKKISSFIALLVMLFTVSFDGHALQNSYNTFESKLYSGKWVKIRVSETGVHEITAEQLSEMGFNDLNAVKIFGKGGYVLDEVLNGNHIDDLAQIPVLVRNDKVIFYAQGVVKASVSSISVNPYHTISVNPYSQYGYYFVTDNSDYEPLHVASAEVITGEASSSLDYCYDYVVHNKELYSFLNSGKTFYGENLQEVSSIDFNMPEFRTGTAVSVAFSIGANVNASSKVSVAINGSEIALNSSTMKKITSNREFELLTTNGVSPALASADKYSLSLSLEDTGINTARLDYFTVTYSKANEFPADSAQMRMAFANPNHYCDVIMKNLSGNVIVWDVTSGTPKAQHEFTGTGADVKFRQSGDSSWEQYVAFKPSGTLKKVVVEGEVENQNLHGMATPDMVIIYAKNFKAQAEKLAAIHQEHDGMDVLIAEQQQIFNEYSSGVQDATAYRLFLKMLYDRKPEKLKYLLLLGCGSFDNRRLMGEKSENQLLTYQSTDSNGIVSSYVTDDYFGFLADGSGKSIPTDVLSISVGRIPAKTVEDAEAAISKTLDYIISDNSELWRGNALIMSDKGDNDLHTTQAEALEILIKESMGADALNLEKIYQEWYLRANVSENVATGTENWARLRLEEMLREGLLYVSYIGHAGAIVLTHDNRLWSSADVQSVRYPYLPFFALAACETAYYDQNERSISEELILAPEGGAIGVLSAARTVYSTQNDKLNRALAQLLFSVKEDGSYRTIGEACKDAKKTFGQTYNYNKLSFTLFGDPAVKIRFPLNRCKVNEINGTSLDQGTVEVLPLTKVSVSGVVIDAQGNTDTSFNGAITVSIFDKELAYKDLTSPNTKVVYNSKFPRKKLCHATGTVKDGTYTVDLVLPANCIASKDGGLIRIFARSVDGHLVSGAETRIMIGEYDESAAIKDSNAPEIVQLLVDGQSQNAYTLSNNPVVYFEASDDVAVNSNPDDIGGSIKLVIDDGKYTVSTLSNYAEVTNGGKSISGSVTIPNLAAGEHVLKLEVSDAAGNTVAKEMSFVVVGDVIESRLVISEDVVKEKAEISLDYNNDIAEWTCVVTDIKNNIVFEEKVSEETFVWGLCDEYGNRVSPGKYSVSAKFNASGKVGYAAPKTLVVLKN